MTKKILLTRSREDNKPLKKALVAKGYECVECSLLEHVNLPFNVTLLEHFSDVIVTSRRAARSLPVADGMKNAWVVGAGSAKILRSKNYDIQCVAPSAEELKRHLPASGHAYMVYFSGDQISVEMPADIKNIKVYRVRYKEKLSEREIRTLRKGMEYIMLYSENCAKTLIKLILSNNLLKYMENALVIAISSKVENVVKGYFAKTVAAADPYQILKKLEEHENKA